MMTRFVELAQRTPDSRDRYIDFLRVFSIVTVVLGHWFMAVPTFDGSHIATSNALSSTAGLWLLTWFLQVMPIFFIVGGFANYKTLNGVGYADFVGSRFMRVLKPVAALIAVWIVLITLLRHLDVGRDVLHPIGHWVTQPLWFVGVYLVLIAIASPMVKLHRRFGTSVPMVLLAMAVGIDFARFRLGASAVGYVNFLVVWTLAQQLGFFYADGSLMRLRRRTQAAMAVVGLGSLAGLVMVLGYPGSMVGQAGDRFSNMSPPTMAIVALTFWQLGALLIMRPYVVPFLNKTKVWALVVAGNFFSMSLYLWHITALIIGVVVLFPLGLAQFEAGSPAWFVSRPLWFALLTVPLVALVAVFARFDRPATRPALSRENT